MLKIFNKKIMKLSKIKIPKEFELHPPKFKKMLEKIAFYLEHRKFEQPIIIDKNNILVDGYTTYLLATECGKKYMLVGVRNDNRL